MKAIQVMMDESILAGFDADEEVRRSGRSAVLRHIVREYLRQRQRTGIVRQYRKAYGQRPGLGDEFAGWDNEGTWPSE